ncbi:MAG: hypothetical protein EOO68_15000 [Moraxellaceae bacterium]|nr:MAG: hypothetical protein EOO68_15000 [Moraxellaceae bacterium]
MNTFAHCVGMLALMIFSAASRAELIYSPNTLLDTATGTTWRTYSTPQAGLLDGFKPATAEQTSTLFLDYAPLNGGNKLPGYNPVEGGIKSISTREDGTSFSASWSSTYLYPGSSPPSLVNAFGFNVMFGGWGPGTDRVESFVGLVQDGNSWASVWLRKTSALDQYGHIWGNESGIIDPPEESFRQKEFFRTACWGPEECNNPFIDASGAVKISGYLMVSSVPELPPAISLSSGVILLSLLVSAKRKINIK